MCGGACRPPPRREPRAAAAAQPHPPGPSTPEGPPGAQAGARRAAPRLARQGKVGPGAHARAPFEAAATTLAATSASRMLPSSNMRSSACGHRQRGGEKLREGWEVSVMPGAWECRGAGPGKEAARAGDPPCCPLAGCTACGSRSCSPSPTFPPQPALQLPLLDPLQPSLQALSLAHPANTAALF